MSVTQRHLTSPADLQALSHPLRLSLLDRLAAEGPATASDLGRRLGESPANVSWHLRYLSKHNFVRQAKGPGRTRPWRYVGQSLSPFQAGDDTPVSTAVADVVHEREFQLLRAASRAQNLEDDAWRAATSVVRSRMWLTAEEAAAVAEKLEALLVDAGIDERSQEPALRPKGARLMALMGWILPLGAAPEPDLP